MHRYTQNRLVANHLANVGSEILDLSRAIVSVTLFLTATVYPSLSELKLFLCRRQHDTLSKAGLHLWIGSTRTA